jgi:hypothetical protein
MSDATLMGLPKEIQDKIVGVDDPECLGNEVFFKFRQLNKESAQQYRVKVHEFALKRLEKVVENDKAEADYRRMFASKVPMNPLSDYDEHKCSLYELNFESFQCLKSAYERKLKAGDFPGCRNSLLIHSGYRLKRELRFKRLYPFNPERVFADIGMRIERPDGTVVEAHFRTPDNVRARQPVPAWEEAPPVAPPPPLPP